MAIVIVQSDNKIGRNYYRWTACSICGNYRWVRLVGNEPRSLVCRKCCSPETRAKMSASHIGHPTSQETRDKISRATQGRQNWLGKRHSDATKQKLSTAHTGKKHTEETKEKLRYINLGKKYGICPDEVRDAVRLVRLGSKASAETIAKLRLSHLGKKPSAKSVKLSGERLRAKWRDPEYRRFMLEKIHSPEAKARRLYAIKEKMTGVPRPKTVRDKIRATLIGHSVSVESIEKMLKNRQKSLHLRPNKPEQKLSEILDSLFPNQWKFVGDLSLIIAGKNPDFVNVNGKKQIIELFGTYWHTKQEAAERISLFSSFGYETLIIWENELKDKVSLSDKIISFSEAYHA